ncbi:substrate-binding domain-containing protein [Ectopseudomonas hydrolytica]|uniref:substrate-binding domain-containing protein n=1 Tax=Ectopseudomonas hydrolytica TaxID=2493633 RepID=UPI0018A709EE|nr:substrate-binding domain-containing protein [Pseudomonas hydrolytica]MBF8159850.1 substrate-binding domain-containing protein [Pseudomonas mendocina]UTH32384.1 substrate-binding domain-containing protein [Pseudomonas hydrolytica]UZZ11574.1 substrate-binding domain-containing protein [Pseudomonas mendocina]
MPRITCLCHLLISAAVLLPGASWARDCIGMVPAGSSTFWSAVEAGARQSADELELDLYTRGLSHDGDVEVQLQLIERVVARGCRGLIIAPTGQAIESRVAALRAQGIPTVYIDRDIAGEGAYGLVATDNFLAGQLAGQQLAELLGGRGRVALLRLRQDLQSTRERERGFLLAAQAAGLEVVFDAYLGDDREGIVAALSEHLPRLDGLFSPNGSSTRATLAALRQLGKAGQVRFVGFDGGDLLFDAVRQREIQALLLQQPQAIGDHAVRLVQRALRGEPAAARLRLLLEPRVLTADKLAEMASPEQPW